MFSSQPWPFGAAKDGCKLQAMFHAWLYTSKTPSRRMPEALHAAGLRGG